MNASDRIKTFAHLANEIAAALATEGKEQGYEDATNEAIESLAVIPSRVLWQAAKLATMDGKQVIENELTRRAYAR